MTAATECARVVRDSRDGEAEREPEEGERGRKLVGVAVARGAGLGRSRLASVASAVTSAPRSCLEAWGRRRQTVGVAGPCWAFALATVSLLFFFFFYFLLICWPY